ncbi:hypothetical protein [Streptomyces sp. NPDC005930]|uniref:hypothetical protein n=1 Tax=Streptomyces sp. NPDC005930 TaxID=3364736 RepID=UPI0036A908CF
MATGSGKTLVAAQSAHELRTGLVLVLDPAQHAVAEGGVEAQGAVQIGKAVRDEERSHAAPLSRRTW